MRGMIGTLWNDHMIGTPIERALLVRRRSRDWLRAGVVFIHIPKAAGTSISEELYGRFLGHISAADVKRWSSPAVTSLPFVAVTRNPWDRLVSAYRFIKSGAGLGGISPGAVWRPEQYAIPEFDSFERFLRDWLQNRDLRKLDFVFQPQSPFVCDAQGEITVDHVGRFEDLASTFSLLNSISPGAVRTVMSNRSGSAVDYRTFYTRELAEIVASLYDEDIARFGYIFDGQISVA